MTSETLAQLLASLPEEERVILTLHYVRSLSSAEIAAMLNCRAQEHARMLRLLKRDPLSFMFPLEEHVSALFANANE